MRNVLLLFILLLLLSCEAETQCEPQPLNILLTNDDGYDQPGITALHRSLKAAGHNVVRVAPSRNYSGASTSLTFEFDSVPKRPDDEFEEIYAVDGSPATAVILGVTGIFDPDVPVDLVISGINNGANLGPSLTGSGTVGAVIAALKMLEPGVPGIGISTGRLSDESSGENLAHLARVADYVSHLIDKSQCSDVSFLNSGQSINVNYPRLAPSNINGVRMARQGYAQYLNFSFNATGDENYEFQFGRVTPGNDIENSDVVLFHQGYITIVPMDGDYSASPAFDSDALLLVEP